MQMNQLKRIAVLLAAGVLSGSALADGSKIYDLSANYKEECGSCHVAYPPALMSSASWRAIMSGLNKHFGSDASLEAAKAKEIEAYLTANSARKDKYAAVDEQGHPLLRMTESAWFRREHRDGHDGITASVWRLPSVKSPANCAACHKGAERGDYSERQISIPRS